MSGYLVLIILAGLGFCYFVNRIVVKSVVFMEQPETLLEELDQIDSPEAQEAFAIFATWANEHGYTREQYFLFRTMNPDMPILCAAWWSLAEKTWALVYYAPKIKQMDFATVYSQTVGVTTGSSKDSLLLPSPKGSYKQAFLRLSFDELHERHLQARAHVESWESVSLPEEKEDLLQLLARAMKQEMAHIQQLPLWTYRGVYWYFIRRNLLINRPVSKQS